MTQDEVVVKEFPAHPAASVLDRARVLGQALSRVPVSGIAAVREYGQASLPGRGSVPYLVRDMVTGQTLEEHLADGPFPAGEALRVVASVADALAVAHRAGVTHGNMVPANVILGRSGVTVTDFGLWALRDGRPDGERRGALSYAAPERTAEGVVNPATDMYSLGVIFVACLTGIGPGGPVPFAGMASDAVPAALASLWAACLGASPGDRPSAAQVAVTSRQILAGSTGSTGGSPGRHRRRRLLAVGGATTGLAAVTVAVLAQLMSAPATTARMPAGAAHPAQPGGGTASAPALSHSATPVATTSVLASPSPSLLHALGQITRTVHRDIASGQMRQDVGVDLENLIKPIQADLTAGRLAPVSGLVSALRAKLATRLSEGALTAHAASVLDTELSTLAASAGRG